jgi:hypothetical protein
MDPPFDYANDDLGDIAFVQATKFIGGRDAMEEFIACGMYPLAAGADFDRVATCTTLVSKLKVPLLKFTVACKDDNEDDACLGHVCNGGRLNHVFELAEVAYGPCAMPDTDEFTEAMWNRKLDAVGKNPSKHPKAVRKKKADVVKIAPSRGKASLK